MLAWASSSSNITLCSKGGQLKKKKKDYTQLSNGGKKKKKENLNERTAEAFTLFHFLKWGWMRTSGVLLTP